MVGKGGPERRKRERREKGNGEGSTVGAAKEQKALPSLKEDSGVIQTVPESVNRAVPSTFPLPDFPLRTLPDVAVSSPLAARPSRSQRH